MKIAALMLALSLGQTTSSDPYVRSRVDPEDSASQCLYWTVPKITYYQSSLGNPATQPAGSELDAVRRSFQSWQDEGYARVNLALCEGELGHWPNVLEHLEECLRLGTQIKDNVLVGVARFVEAQARMHVGDFELARRSLEAGKVLEEALGSAEEKSNEE